MAQEAYHPKSCMKNVLAHDPVKQTAKAVNVNVAMLSAAEKKVLEHSPAREVSGGMVRIPVKKFAGKDQERFAQALKDANPSPVTRRKGRSYGGGVSSIVF